MRQKKIPTRKCIGCREMKPKQELIRIVRAPSVKDEEGEIIQKGELSVDATGKKNGRGAYICRSIDCFNTMRKTRALERTFSCKIPDEIYETLEKELSELDK